MTDLVIDDRAFAHLRRHLRSRVEQAAFLLADYEDDGRAFHVRNVRFVDARQFDIQTAYHISLADETRAELIRWAWSEHASLVEIHSHTGDYPAAFSATDLSGFAEWVPHVWWRLAGRPYVAVVTAGASFDGLAWIDDPREPERLNHITLSGGRTLEATGLTLISRTQASTRRTDLHG